MLTAVGSFLVGSTFAIIAWGQVAYRWIAKAIWNPPRALYLFTATVLMHTIGLVCYWEYNGSKYDLSGRLAAFILALFVIFGCACLIYTLLSERGRSEKPDVTVWIGCRALLLIAIIGLIVFVLSLPGMPFH